MRKSLLRIARLSLAAACLAGFAWLLTESASMASANNLSGALHAVSIVALRTQFGHWMVLRLGLLILALPLLRRPTIAGAVAGAAFAVQPLLGHAGAIGGGVGAEMIASEVLHVLAAGAWLGGLLPLFLAVRRLPRELAVATCRSFTPVGLAAVMLLAGTAIVQAASLVGGLPGLLGTSYGLLGVAVVLIAAVLASRTPGCTRSRYGHCHGASAEGRSGTPTHAPPSPALARRSAPP